MKRFGIIGNPISHSLSPALFRAAYGGRYPYDLIETADFQEAWKRFLRDYDAINVTAPFKAPAFEQADIPAPECRQTGATNLLVKTPEGIRAYNSDYLAVKDILASLPRGTAAVIGFGGAGKAALAAAEELGFRTRVFRHGEIRDGVSADVILYTLPRPVEGIDRLDCAHLVEANYKDPCLTAHPGYIPGTEWLLRQALLGYGLMTGETPDAAAMQCLFHQT